MAKVESQDGASVVINARRTESLDAPYILQLAQPWTEKLFGRVNIVNVIEKAVLAVTLINDKEDIMAHAAFFDYPNVPSVDQAAWEEWMGKDDSDTVYTALNSLFLHYFVAQPDYAQGCFKEIVRTAFTAIPDLHFLILVIPIGIYPDPSISTIFTPLKRKSGSNPAPSIFVCRRHNHVPVLHIRGARVEDNDDLTPIFNRQSDMLKTTYGEYFLAEMIEAQDENMHCLVAEVEGKAVGFMSISSDVSVNLLNECFELGPFHGLRKPHENDVTSAPPSLVPSPLPTNDVDRQYAPSIPGTIHRTLETLVEDSGTDERPDSQSSDYSSSLSQSGEPKVVQSLTDVYVSEPGSPHFDTAWGDATVTHPSTFSKVSRETGRTTPKLFEPAFKKRFVPKYNGRQNCFSIQLFCIDEGHEMRSCDFLPEAFSFFPDYDYCIITVPHLVPELPLIQNFVRVTPRCPSILPHELYIFHRAGLLKNFSVKPARSEDYSSVETLVKNIQLNENLLADLTQYNIAGRDPDGTEIQAYVAKCQNQTVGVAILRREEDIEYIRSHYNIEDFIYYNHHRREDHGHLHHFVLNPIFAHLTKHFLKEILRLSHKTCVYYPLYPRYSSKETLSRHSVVCCLGALVPVRARHQIKYPVQQLGINAPSVRVLAERETYALNHINRKLTLEPKVAINARIVVVGASDVGLSFLETFSYCPHLRFNNMTLISPHGLLGEMPADPQRDQMLPSSYCYSQEEHAKVSLRTFVNLVYGRMTAIDRKKKIVTVDGKYQVPFDHLVLCTGQQFYVPAPTGADVDEGADNENLPANPDNRLLKPPPKNLYLVNDAYNAAAAQYMIKNYLMKTNGLIIVYGGTINAYTCIQSMLVLGVKGSNIALVEPPAETPCFEDTTVMNTVKNALTDAGVQMYSGYYLARWNNSVEIPEIITSASFTSSGEPLKLDCQAFFSFYKKAVDMDAFKSMNNACLVYDGKLVIDASFHTNDVAIRAAGPLTKFQRRYHADQWTHACFNSKEVGMALANEMLRLFDPTLDSMSSPPEEPLNLIPMYRSPRLLGGYLPGGYQYLEVSKPGLMDPPDVQLGQLQPGREVFSGQPENEDGYMKLGISQYQAIDKIVCLSKQEFPASNFICLYGIHQRSLNNLVARYDEGLIKNLYSFFRESWAMAIFHDRFSDLRDELRELLITSPEDRQETMEDKVRHMVDEEVGISEAQRHQLMDLYKASGSKQAVETRLLSFLSYNYYHLPMYAKPGMV
ncbi:cilia- and flagella-associated protein 61-like isoform X2 [Pomacea canaliculata]|uniref:cilia- and flagella-associated protein 61-like isoform X2 n=1 Tax=Pomacea canaliculata TaxID=400727 RepID=UPI000D7338EB|nr:cilia- and flagella-associated protein 61-like isoform X2 [Pomacea canaliculata]